MTASLILAVETGGTRIRACLAEMDGTPVADAKWETTTPDRAAADILEFVRMAADRPVVACGIASFGPILLHSESNPHDVGRMLPTPKPGWTNSNLRAVLQTELGVPCVVDTDVNAAARAEHMTGAGRGDASLAYVTVGTGIGGGLSFAGHTLRGALHPEIGHLRLVRDADDADHVGACPYHSDCAEALAAGPAVALRLRPGERIEDRPDVVARVAGYIAQLMVAIVLAWSPHRIVLGGGIGTASDMLTSVREKFAEQLGDYGVGDAPRASGFIVAPTLEDAGLEGAIMMAIEVAGQSGRITA